MADILLRIFSFFEKHTIFLRALLIGFILLCIAAISRISFVEDISSFLPQSKENERIQYASQHIGTSNKLMVTISSDSTDEYIIIDAIETFVATLQQRDTAQRIQSMFYTVDQQKITEVGQFVIQNMPLYLTDKDYGQLSQRLSYDSIVAQLNKDKQILLSPMGGFVKNFITFDPLGIATPLLSSLNESNATTNYENIDGYIFDKSGTEALVSVSSKFPISDTSENAKLIADIDSAI